MFIGRETELKFLEERYNSNKSELVVLYGRRRVGKTETLRQFCKNKPHIFFSCRECIDKLQLKTFSEKIIRCNLISSLQDICWCEQIHAYDSDTGYDYYLDVYFTNGEKKRVSAASVYDAFRLALAVKDNVPHLLYEPCEEYKRIYQENPRQFLEIVKQRG